MRLANTEKYRNKFRGSLIGGAVGDALGFPVEFLDWKRIQKQYGPNGIQEYMLNPKTGEAVISDDTQMTLYTANGLLLADTRELLTGEAEPAAEFLRSAYIDWCTAQYDSSPLHHGRVSWLNDIPVMHAWRAPGNTCLSSLETRNTGSVAHPSNNSKGCGGVMRVAPVGLFYPCQDEAARLQIDQLGAEAAAITHGHPLGYIPAAMLTHIINIGVYGSCSRGESLPDAVEDSLEAMRRLFPKEDAACTVMEALTKKAIALAEAGGDDEANIRALGQGWVADEALAIALYCCLRYPDDFSGAMIASVNHSGDSDSTGAIAGNILGAWLGYDAIEEKWLNHLEAKQLILETADDLCRGCQAEADPIWKCKYLCARYAKTEAQAQQRIAEMLADSGR